MNVIFDFHHGIFTFDFFFWEMATYLKHFRVVINPGLGRSLDIVDGPDLAADGEGLLCRDGGPPRLAQLGEGDGVVSQV